MRDRDGQRPRRYGEGGGRPRRLLLLSQGVAGRAPSCMGAVEPPADGKTKEEGVVTKTEGRGAWNSQWSLRSEEMEKEAEKRELQAMEED